MNLIYVRNAPPTHNSYKRGEIVYFIAGVQLKDMGGQLGKNYFILNFLLIFPRVFNCLNARRKFDK